MPENIAGITGPDTDLLREATTPYRNGLGMVKILPAAPHGTTDHMSPIHAATPPPGVRASLHHHG